MEQVDIDGVLDTVYAKNQLRLKDSIKKILDSSDRKSEKELLAELIVHSSESLLNLAIQSTFEMLREFRLIHMDFD